jgi:hypothetical protein
MIFIRYELGKDIHCKDIYNDSVSFLDICIYRRVPVAGLFDDVFELVVIDSLVRNL